MISHTVTHTSTKCPQCYAKHHTIHESTLEARSRPKNWLYMTVNKNTCDSKIDCSVYICSRKAYIPCDLILAPPKKNTHTPTLTTTHTPIHPHTHPSPHTHRMWDMLLMRRYVGMEEVKKGSWSLAMSVTASTQLLPNCLCRALE